MPIIGKLEDGNASDKKINNQVLSDISKHMNKHGIADEAFIYIADSAMVTEENLTLANRFITRLPATYKACDHAIASAVDEDQWIPVGCIAITPGSKKKPSAEYRLNEQKVTLYDKEYRAIVVHSSAHDSRREKRLIREMSQSLKSANAVAKKFEKKIVFCQADAEEAMKELMGNTTQYHQFKTKIVECPRYSRGRPKQGATRTPIATDYKLLIEVTEKTQEIAEREKVSGCFVLITNVEPDWRDGYDPEKILRTYKDQYGIENNFSFLKDDQFVNAIFLKRPERIEAIGLVFLIALLVWRLMEHTMRSELKHKNATIPGWDNKETKRPTSYMLTWKFKGVMSLCIGGTRQLAKPLSQVQRRFLEILKIPINCFTDISL